MKLVIDEKFDSVIWRMEIDEFADMLIVEVRDSSEKQVSFGSINLTNGKTYFKNLTTPERWLTGVEAAYDGVLLLHSYQTESGPAHKGLIAIDASTGETLWSNYNLTFDHLSGQGPVVYDSRFQPRKLFLVDIKTGATSGSYDPSVYQELTNNILTPELTTEETFSELVQMPVFGNIVHYLEFNKSEIVSLHTLTDGKINQHLLIMNDGVKVYEDLLNNNIQKIQPEAFILHKNRLIYIKNKSELKVLAL